MIQEILQKFGQLFVWFIVVAPWEQAIRVRLGKHSKKLTAGFYMKIPFIDRVFRQSIRRRINLIRAQTLTTLDGYVITCAGAIGFSIGDLEKLYDTLESPNDTVENEVSGLISKFIGQSTKDQCKAHLLEEYVKKELKLSQYGLDGQEFYLTSFAMSKTYRVITGDLSSWSRDNQMNMKGNHEEK